MATENRQSCFSGELPHANMCCLNPKVSMLLLCIWDRAHGWAQTLAC